MTNGKLEKNFYLNDQGLRVTISVKNDDIIFDFDKSISFLEKYIKIKKRKDDYYVCLGLKKLFKITKNDIEMISPITSSEIRLLSAFNNCIKDRNIDLFYFFKISKNISFFSKKKWKSKQKLKTELHTHLIEILNPSEFIEFLNKYKVNYPINQNGQLDLENGYHYSYEDIVDFGKKEELENSLRLDLSCKCEFSDMSNVICNRHKLMQYACKNYEKEVSSKKDWIDFNQNIEDKCKNLKSKILKLQEKRDKTNNTESKKTLNEEINKLNGELNKLADLNSSLISTIVYNDLLDECLNKLKRENIEYSEISYSNNSRIEYIARKHQNDDSFRMLYSIDRKKKVNEFKKYAANLQYLLENNMIIGTDIMGLEEPLESSVYTEFKDKLEWILPVLHIHKNSVLRIHASEFKDCTDNLYKSLKAIKEVSERINKTCMSLFGETWGMIPPPRIRIGHGVNINKNKRLVELIKEFGAVIEFNISSNYALGHISDLTDFPIDFYEKNEIDYVISTDGGGMYSTSIHQEENIFNMLKEDSKNALKKSKETEKKFITNNLGQISVKDKELYEKLMFHYKSKKEKVREYPDYITALKYENKILSTENEVEKIKTEIDNLKRYMMDNEVTFDIEEFNEKMQVVIQEIDSSKKSDFAKMWLYFMEKEFFPEIDTSFKSVEYLDMNKDINDDAMKLYSLFNLVKEVYEEKYSIKKR